MNTGIGGTIATIIQGVITQVNAVLVPAAVLALIICMILFFISKSERSVDQARSWGIRIAVGLTIALLAQKIVDAIKATVDSTVA